MYNGSNNMYQQMGYSENPYTSTVNYAAEQVRQQQYQQSPYGAYPNNAYQPPQYQQPSYQQNYNFITQEATIVKIRQAIFNVLKDFAQQDKIQTEFVARYTNNDMMMESLVEDCCWNVFSYINPMPQNASDDQIVSAAVSTVALYHLVTWLFEPNQYPEYYRAIELSRINPEAANKYTQLNKSGSLAQIAQKSRGLKQQVMQMGMTYRGPQASAMVSGGYGQPQQPAYAMYGGTIRNRNTNLTQQLCVVWLQQHQDTAHNLGRRLSNHKRHRTLIRRIVRSTVCMMSVMMILSLMRHLLLQRRVTRHRNHGFTRQILKEILVVSTISLQRLSNLLNSTKSQNGMLRLDSRNPFNLNRRR